jgi:hypothetical protein
MQYYQGGNNAASASAALLADYNDHEFAGGGKKKKKKPLQKLKPVNSTKIETQFQIGTIIRNGGGARPHNPPAGLALRAYEKK